jgi:hypothetical protein
MLMLLLVGWEATAVRTVLQICELQDIDMSSDWCLTKADRVVYSLAPLA